MKRQRFDDVRWRGAIAVFVFFVLASSTVHECDAALIIRKAGGGSLTQLSDALVKALEKKPVGKKTKVVELSGDTIADGAKLVRESGDETVVFAIGPEAAAAAGDIDGMKVVALAVPNPSKVKTSGTYISIYPKLEQIFDFLKDKLHAKSVGFLYSSNQNTEVALEFKKISDGHGIMFHPLAVASSADLIRTMKQALPKIDALVLAVDPILFDRQNLKVIVNEALSAKKPTVGFLEGLPGLGVTVSLVAEASTSAALAVGVAGEGSASGKKLMDVETSLVVFSRKSAEAIGISPEALGANKIQ